MIRFLGSVVDSDIKGGMCDLQQHIHTYSVQQLSPEYTFTCLITFYIQVNTKKNII